MAEPTTITIPGAVEGLNCRLTVGGYGVFLARTTRLGFSLDILSNESEAANRRAFYPWVTTGSSFQMAVIHTSWADREAFNSWVQGYMRAVAGNRPISGSMKVEVPARRFTRMAVCKGSLQFGDRFDTAWWLSMLDFEGASEPVNVGVGQTTGVSYYKAPTTDAKTGANFYPSGQQVSGAESLAGTMFDPNPDTPAPTTAELRETYRILSSAGLVTMSGDNFVRMSQ